MNFIIRYFVRGLVIVIPIAVTCYILYLAFITIDRLLGLAVPGLGFLVTIVFIIVVGFLGSNILGRKLLQIADRLFVRAPFVKILYTSIKDLIEAFVGDRRRFNIPALVTLSDGGDVAVVGFITSEELTSFGLEDHVAVYFPQSYNFAGNLVFVARKNVRKLEMESSHALAFIVSGGVSRMKET